MKYRDLLDKCKRMTEEQLNMDVTIHVNKLTVSDDEFLKVDHLELIDVQEDDRLDDGHPILVIFDIELD